MNSYPYRILMGSGVAMLVGVVGAQTYGDQPAADKNAPQNVQAQPSSPSDRTSVDSTAQSPVVKGATTNAHANLEPGKPQNFQREVDQVGAACGQATQQA